MINYIEGDLFAAIKDNPNLVFIPHVCNDKGAFGAGFVVPLAKHFPDAASSYHLMKPVLGSVGFVEVGNVVICNMVAQTLGGQRPLYYNHLVTCMDKVAREVARVRYLGKTVEIHAPAFGSGLAGGSFQVIEPLIVDCWIRAFNTPPAINIYYLPGTFLPPEEETK